MFTSRQELKRQLTSTVDQLQVANERNNNLRRENDTLKNRVAGLESKNKALEEKGARLAKELKESGAMVRKQTEADILLNALTAVGIIKDESPKQPDRNAEHKRLIEQQYRAAQAMGGCDKPFAGFCGNHAQGQSLFDAIFG
jgi:cell division septum initiation protein DivIVA